VLDVSSVCLTKFFLVAVWRVRLPKVRFVFDLGAGSVVGTKMLTFEQNLWKRDELALIAGACRQIAWFFFFFFFFLSDREDSLPGFVCNCYL
jgi:hypothetical protein